MARSPLVLRIEPDPDPEQKSTPAPPIPEWQHKLLWDPNKEAHMKTYECIGPLPADAPVWVAMWATRGENVLGPDWTIESDWGKSQGKVWQSWTAIKK